MLTAPLSHIRGLAATNCDPCHTLAAPGPLASTPVALSRPRGHWPSWQGGAECEIIPPEGWCRIWELIPGISLWRPAPALGKRFFNRRPDFFRLSNALRHCTSSRLTPARSWRGDADPSQYRCVRK